MSLTNEQIDSIISRGKTTLTQVSTNLGLDLEEADGVFFYLKKDEKRYIRLMSELNHNTGNVRVWPSAIGDKSHYLRTKEPFLWRTLDTDDDGEFVDYTSDIQNYIQTIKTELGI